MPKVIELDRLLKGACREQAEVVRTEWPTGIPLTQETARRVVELNLSLSWAAEKLLNSAAWEAYGEARKAARKAYDEACFAARKAHEEACDAARKAYDEARAGILLNLLLQGE